MLKKILLFLPVFALTLTADAQFKGLKKLGDKAKQAKEKVLSGAGLSEGALSQADVGNALKEALEKGAGEATDFLSAADGYYKSPYKILIPEDAQKVTKKLSRVPGWKGVEQKLEEKMNRAAELAAAKAKPILVKAITGMSFKDAMNILMGEKNAATTYLHDNTHENLIAEFLPVIQSSLDEVNARDYWRGAVTAYNKLPFVSKANPELDNYVTLTALKGMFSLVEKKELDIRDNVGSRSTDLMRRVFAKQDSK